MTEQNKVILLKEKIMKILKKHYESIMLSIVFVLGVALGILVIFNFPTITNLLLGCIIFINGLIRFLNIRILWRLENYV